jgi:protein-serine/threonine kinase
VEHPASSQLGYDSADSQTYDVWSVRSRQRRRYRKIRQLGQGAFSEVVLGVREEYTDPHTTTIYTGPPRLVAIKVVEFGPAGGADEDRVKVSLKREVEILKSINHPSLVQLKAYGSDGKTALLALDYCPGGDLFEVASHGSSCLTPAVIRRIFAELVDAVRYLHRNLIVHRDIKLESKSLPPKPPSIFNDVPT